MGFFPKHSNCKGDADKEILYHPIFFICAENVSILVRNNKGIKGITVDGTEYLISQYADDTIFILDGSSESLNNSMSVFDY